MVKLNRVPTGKGHFGCIKNGRRTYTATLNGQSLEIHFNTVLWVAFTEAGEYVAGRRTLAELREELTSLEKVGGVE